MREARKASPQSCRLFVRVECEDQSPSEDEKAQMVRRDKKDDQQYQLAFIYWMRGAIACVKTARRIHLRISWGVDVFSDQKMREQAFITTQSNIRGVPKVEDY